MLRRVKLDHTLLTCDQGNFNQITARSQSKTLVTVVRDMCPAALPSVPPIADLQLGVVRAGMAGVVTSTL